MDSENKTSIAIGCKVCNKYKVTKLLGGGSYGCVHEVIELKTGDRYAMKSEYSSMKKPILLNELKVMKAIYTFSSQHVLKVRDMGVHGSTKFIIMQMLEKNMDEVFELLGGSMTLNTAVATSYQCLEGLEFMHWAGFLHRDIKPNNYCLDANSGFYLLAYFTVGKLPWSLLEDRKAIGDAKKRSSVEPHLQVLLPGCPSEYFQIFKYIQSLTFFAEPKYEDIYEKLEKVISARKLKNFKFDWEHNPAFMDAK